MKIHIHYRASDGEIFGYENSEKPDGVAGLEYVTLDAPEGQQHIIPDSMLHKIDLATLSLIDKTDAQRKLARNPPITIAEMEAAIRSELRATDSYVVYDRPLTVERRAAWFAYRQMLRDLSDLPSVDAMMAVWTLDPNGNDAIAAIRARHAEASS